MMPAPGQIVFALHRGSSAIGKLIRWQTRGDYSHVSVILPGGRHVEAREFRGVIQHETFTPNPGESVDFVAIEVTPAQLAKAEDFIRRELGAPYDYAMVWHFITRGGPIRESDERWFCSEFAYALALAMEVELLRTRDAWRISPALFGLSPIPHPLAA